MSAEASFPTANDLRSNLYHHKITQLSAQNKWRKCGGQNRLPEIIHGIEFKDGIKQIQKAARSGNHQLSSIVAGGIGILAKISGQWFRIAPKIISVYGVIP